MEAAIFGSKAPGVPSSTLENPSGCQGQKSCSGREEGEQRRRRRVGNSRCIAPSVSSSTGSGGGGELLEWGEIGASGKANISAHN